jgi:integrase/recombinase XerD
MTDLFDHAVYWRAAPLEAFRAFVKSHDFVKLARHRPYDIGPAGAKVPRPIRDSSAVIYTHMFATFARWMETQKLTLFDITGSHVREFLDATRLVDGKAAKRLNSSIRVRYLRLLERVFAHLHLEPNPARLAAYEVHKAMAGISRRPR